MKRQTTDRSRFYAPNAIGDKRSTTPEGFLICHDVPIARTGQQLYTADEIPIDPGPDGLIRVDRPPEEVFRDETLASFEGKAVTVEHPEDFVSPENWKSLSIGTVQNVRRGDGINDDLLIADLVITDPGGIEYVNKELPEVSAGYEAEYVQTGPGRGLQRGIVGNHVALVDRGRAGPRCSIQDKEPEMPIKKKGFFDRLRAFIKDAEMEEEKKEETADEEAEAEAEKKAKAGETKDEGDDVGARLARIEAALAKLVPAEEAEHGESFDEFPESDKGAKDMTGDEIIEPEPAETNSQAKGTVLSGDSLKQVVARAEILAPGIAVPTGDAVKAKDAAPKLMRKALEASYTTDAGKAAIDPFLSGRQIKTLTGDALASAFSGAAELVRAQNNMQGRRTSITKDFGKATTVEAINARNRDFWAR